MLTFLSGDSCSYGRIWKRSRTSDIVNLVRFFSLHFFSENRRDGYTTLCTLPDTTLCGRDTTLWWRPHNVVSGKNFMEIMEKIFEVGPSESKKGWCRKGSGSGKGGLRPPSAHADSVWSLEKKPAEIAQLCELEMFQKCTALSRRAQLHHFQFQSCASKENVPSPPKCVPSMCGAMR